MLKYELIPVTAIEQNCRIFYDDQTKAAFVVDPGGNAERIMKVVNKLELKVCEIWLTHSHFDHCGAVAEVQKQTGAKLLAHKAESEFRSQVKTRAVFFGIGADLEDCPEPDQYIEEGDILDAAGLKFKVFFTPGHSPGHVVFYQPENNLLIAGDTVFSGSIGRTDLPGGNYQLLINNIRSKILTLPDDTIIMSGHGPDTTVGEERASNPFLSE